MKLQLIIAAIIVSGASGQPEKSNLDDPALFCDGCFALVSEVVKDMSDNSAKQKLQARIDQSLDNVCITDRLRSYKFSPPTQVKTCNAILDKYRILLTGILKTEFSGGKMSSVEAITERFCMKVKV